MNRRCAGYTSSDGTYANCTREERAGGLPLSPKTTPASYGHRLNGKCKCGQSHGADLAETKPRGGDKGFETHHEAVKWWGEKNRWKPIKEWSYRDATGREIGVMARFEKPDGKKTYRPIHVTAGGGWKIGDPPGLWPLYRLPEIIDPPLVTFHEGEKCADVAADLGLVASTTAHGAESPRKTDHSPLAGKTVWIFPDNDAAGSKYVENLISLWSTLSPRPTVKVVRLPGLNNKGDDISEFVDIRINANVSKNDIRDEIIRLCDSATVEEFPEPTAAACTNHDKPDYRFTDLGNAERMIKSYGDKLRYVHAWSKWLVWDGRRWKIDTMAIAYGYGIETARDYLAEGAKLIKAGRWVEDGKELCKWAIRVEAKKNLDSMVTLASKIKGVPIDPSDLDLNPWLFNCRNGTIDLRTGRLQPHNPADLITKLCPVDYDPKAKCPLWDETLAVFFKGEADLVDFWQRLCGYAITGVIEDHILPIAYGTGSNGKSTILGSLIDTCGPDYAMKAAPDLLVAKRMDGHPTDRADLFGKRIVVAIETDDGQRLNETLVKELTGGDRIRARRMREDFWEFEPTHTVFLATNHKPQVKGTDRGIWRRLKLVPFDVKMEDANAKKNVPRLLKKESAGILAWIVRGCLAWQAEGLKTPKCVVDATDQYREDEDVLGRFIAEHCVVKPAAKVKSSVLYNCYKGWSENSGLGKLSAVKFGKAIEERGFRKERSDGIQYHGIGLSPVLPSESSESSEPDLEQLEQLEPNSRLNSPFPRISDSTPETVPTVPTVPKAARTHGKLAYGEPPPSSHAYRTEVATWPIPLRQRWADRSEALQTEGVNMWAAEEQSYDEITGVKG